MTKNTSNEAPNGHVGVEIASMALTTDVNPILHGEDFWSLQDGGFASANFEGAWAYATGKGVLVGLVDQGVNYTHLDLSNNYATELDYDPRDDVSAMDAMPDDPNQQHGTEVAGIVAGSIDNTIGTIGAASGATITASYIRYGSNVDMGELANVLSQVSQFDVANNSWGFTQGFTDNFHEEHFSGIAGQFENAATNGRGGLGTAIVMAGGNGKFNIEGQNFGDDSNFHNLSNSRYVIAVGAHNSLGEAAFFSSPGTNLLLSAPGVALVTTAGNAVGSQGSAYVSGTSFAAPLVSSAIALMLEVNPDLGYRDIQSILAITARSSEADGAAPNGALNFNGSGLVFDREMGFGRLDAEAAVKLAMTWTGHATAANEEHLSGAFVLPAEFGPISQSIDVTIDNPGSDGFSTGFVELTLEISDGDLRNLAIELVSPNGTRALIAPNLFELNNQTYLNFTFSSVVTWGEDPFGTWTVNLTHAAASDDFSVLNATIDIYGDTKGTDDTYYFTSSYERLVADDPNRSTIADLNGGIDTLNFAAASGGVVIDLADGGANALDGTSITLDDGFENAVGTSDNDRLSGSSADNLLIGFYGDDSLSGRDGNDALKGGEGNDLLAGGAGADVLDGGNGVDTADYSDAGSGVGINLDSGQNLGDAAGDTLFSIETFRFGAYADEFTGASGNTAEIVYGGGGADMLDGGGGADWLDGGAGADIMIGGSGNDVFIVDNAGDIASDLANGGMDTVLASVSLTLAGNVENATLTGAGAINATGNGLNNVLAGNAASNILTGGAGADRMIGGGGNDIFVIDSRSDSVVELANQGVDTVRAFANYMLAGNVENLQLMGRAYSGIGNGLANLMQGSANGDVLWGEAGNDRLFGNGGNDTLRGGLGVDILSSGAGRDTFDFNHVMESGYGRAAPDLIADFAHGLDRIDLSGIDANIRVAGNQAFAFLGANNFTAHAGELITRAYASATYLFADVNGDGHADMQIQFVGHLNLVTSDFLL